MYFIALVVLANSSCNEAEQFGEYRASGISDSTAGSQAARKTLTDSLESGPSEEELLTVSEPVSVGGAFLAACRQVGRSDNLITTACTLTNKDTNDLANAEVEVLSVGLEIDEQEIEINLIEKADGESVRFSFSYDSAFKVAHVNLLLKGLLDEKRYEGKIPFEIVQDAPTEQVFNLVTETVQTFKLGNDGLNNFVRCPLLETKASDNNYFGSSASIEFEVLATMNVVISINGICDNGSANSDVEILANYQLIEEGVGEIVQKSLPEKGNVV